MSNIGSMRGSKLKASEAALLAGELTKPSWQSKNEGIHERVSFEDSIWGFDLAGGLFYKTPLRVTAVKHDSRAEKAGIRPGDKLLRINDIDTSTLTIQEAHQIIIESGIHIRLAVSAPEDTEDSYGCYQDPVEEQMRLDKLKKEEDEKRKKKWKVQYKVNENWSLMWPWVSKRKVIYRESNCFMVPSKYENRHRDKFPLPTFGPKPQDDIVLHSQKSETPVTEKTEPQFDTTDKKEEKEPQFEATGKQEEKVNGVDSSHDKVSSDSVDERVKLEETNKTVITNGVNASNGETPMDLELDENNNVKEQVKEVNDSEENEEDRELENWDPNENSNTEEIEKNEEAETNDEDDEDDYEYEETNEEENNKMIDDVLNGNEFETDGIEKEI